MRVGPILSLLVPLGLVACGGEPAPSAAAEDAIAIESWGVQDRMKATSPAREPGASQSGNVPEPRADFGPGVRGLRLKRSIVVRSQPSLEAEKLGTAAAHTIVGWKRARVAAGCETRWIEIEPRGWVCEGYLEAVDRWPAGVELPKLDNGDLVPGIYGKVVAEEAVLVDIEDQVPVHESPILGASTVRKRGETRLGDELYWKIDGGKYIAESALRLHEASEFQGQRLQEGQGLELPLGFAFSRNRPGDWVSILDGPGGAQVRRVAARTVLEILATHRDSAGRVSAYQIGEAEWIDARDLRVAQGQEPPETTLPNERWVDVDLDSQVLVAYEGSLPVYATLISSGTRTNETPTGIFRIWIKFSETSMSGRMGESDAYSVATVPWTQFYENDFALHTSYWHDRFGQKRSHGCVNLSPRDSRFLYFWSDPQVPEGWSMANSSSELPGSMVRVRSKADPNPAFAGRAKQVFEERRASL